MLHHAEGGEHAEDIRREQGTIEDIVGSYQAAGDVPAEKVILMSWALLVQDETSLTDGC